MSPKTATRLLMALAILLPLGAVAEALVIGPELPLRIATHFGWNGHADGWMQKERAFLVLGIVTLVVILPLAFLPLLFRRLPPSMINLPHREYWLADERREATVGYLACWCAAFAAGTSAFLGWTQHLVLMANLAQEHPRLGSSFGWSLGAYLLLTVLGTAALFVRFRQPPGESGQRGVGQSS